MAHKLADELLKTILAPPLRVAEQRFADLGPVSPYSKVTRSSSSVLLVCKRWMRVATPCLYEIVVLRSTAQAYAFSVALTRNPEFGEFVKRLRLEASYSKYLTTKIISNMQNIRSLCIPIGVMASERGRDIHDLLTVGSVQTLLIVDYRPHSVNASRTAILAKINEQILGWTSLTQFCCTITTWTDIGTKVSAALSASKSIESIRISDIRHDPGPGSFQNVLANAAIKLVSFYGREKPRGLNLPVWKKIPSAAGRVVFNWSGGSLRFKSKQPLQGSAAVEVARIAEEAVNPFWHPMESTACKIRITIWSRILSFALRTNSKPVSRFGRPWFDAACVKVAVARSTLLVSREFHDATIRALFTHLRPRSSAHYTQIQLHMSRDPVLASLSRSLWMVQLSSGAHDITDCVDSIISSLKRLATLKVSSWPLPEQASLEWYRDLGVAMGRTLLILHFTPFDCATYKTLDPAVLFGDLVVLEELYWSTSYVVFEETQLPDGSEGLSQLRNLRVADFHYTFFDFFESINLSRLISFNISHSIENAQGFLLRNGDNIKKLYSLSMIGQPELDALRMLQTLVLPTSTPIAFFQLSSASVTKINFGSSSYLDRRSRDEGSLRSRLAVLCQNAANFPNLRKIILITAKDIWPTNERDEKNNAWTSLAEELMDLNITLKDGNGRGWRKRLTLPPTTKARLRSRE